MASNAKPSSRGKAFYGHAPGGHDDCAAAVAVCVTHCALSAQHVPVYAVAVPGPNWSGQEPKGFGYWAAIADRRMAVEEGMSAEEVELHREREAILGVGYREKRLLK